MHSFGGGIVYTCYWCFFSSNSPTNSCETIPEKLPLKVAPSISNLSGKVPRAQVLGGDNHVGLFSLDLESLIETVEWTFSLSTTNFSQTVDDIQLNGIILSANLHRRDGDPISLLSVSALHHYLNEMITFQMPWVYQHFLASAISRLPNHLEQRVSIYSY